MRTSRLDFSGAQNIINPEAELAKAFQQTGSNLNQMITQSAEKRRAEEALKQQAIQNQRAEASLRLQQAAGQREADKYARDVAGDEALQQMAKESGNLYKYANQTELDKHIMGNQNLLIGDQTPVPEGTTPALDEELYKRQAYAQSLYEQQKPTTDDATAAIIKEGVAKGADPVQMAALAKTMTSGLTSKADQLKTDQQTAEDYNKRQELLFKEAGKDFRSQLSSSKLGKGGEGSVIGALTAINPSQWIGGDRGDALNDANAMTAAIKKNNPNISDKDIDRLVASGLKYASGKTDWWNGDVEFNAGMFKDYMTEAVKNPTSSLNKATGYNERPTLERAMTVNDLVQQRARQKEKDLNAAMETMRNIGKPVAQAQTATVADTNDGNNTNIEVPQFREDPEITSGNYKNRIASIESGGDYNAVSPDKGAFGKYQFRESTLRGLGYKGTTEEFLKSPGLQESYMTKLTDANKEYFSKNLPGFDNMPESVQLQWLAKAHNHGAPQAITNTNTSADLKYMDKFLGVNNKERTSTPQSKNVDKEEVVSKQALPSTLKSLYDADINISSPVHSTARKVASFFGDETPAALTDRTKLNIVGQLRRAGIKDLDGYATLVSKLPENSSEKAAVEAVYHDVAMQQSPEYREIYKDKQLNSALNVGVNTISSALMGIGVGGLKALVGLKADKVALEKMVKHAEKLRNSNLSAAEAVAKHQEYIKNFVRRGKSQ